MRINTRLIMCLLLFLSSMTPCALGADHQTWIPYFGAWATEDYTTGIVDEPKMTPDLAWEYFVQGVDELNSDEPYWGFIRLGQVYDYVIEGNDLPAFVAPYCKERFLSELAYYYGVYFYDASVRAMDNPYLEPSFQESSDAFQLVLADKAVEDWLRQNDIRMWLELMCYEGENQFMLGHYDQTVEYLQKALKTLPELPSAADYALFYSSVWISLVQAQSMVDHNYVFSAATDEDAYACQEFFENAVIARAPSELTLEERRTYGNILLASGLYEEAAEQLSLVLEERTKLNPKQWAKARANCTKARWLDGQISTQQAMVEFFAVMQMCNTKYPDVYVDASYAQIQLLWYNGQYHEYAKAIEQLLEYAQSVTLEDELSREILASFQEDT